MKYILTYKAKRKDAKRHIWGRYDSLQECMAHADNKHYDFSVYTGNWELIYEVKPLRYHRKLFKEVMKNAIPE